MLMRENQSQFLDSLSVSKRGLVKVAASQLPTGKDATSKHEVKKVLKTFEKSPDVSKDTLKQYQQRAELDTNPKQVAQDFFKDLGNARKQKKQMSLVTAMSLRQSGVFKMAGRDVYEDLETGDFWKMSEDKKHVMRLFKEDEKGIADKRASVEVEALIIKDPKDLINKKFRIINLEDNRSDFEHGLGKEEAEKLFEHEGQRATVKSIETATDNTNPDYTYFNVEFADGYEVVGLSGMHIDYKKRASVEKSSFRSRKEIEIDFRQIVKDIDELLKQTEDPKDKSELLQQKKSLETWLEKFGKDAQ